MKHVFVISDLHIGNGNDLSIFNAAAPLTRFLEHVAATENAELVILGDALDYLQIEPFLGFTNDIAKSKTEEILKAYPALFAALGKVAQQRSLVWVIGNHDVELLYKDARDLIEATLGAEVDWRLDTEAVVYELALGQTARLVHGNAADHWNSIDYAQAEAVVQNGGDFEYPPGSRLVNDVMNPLKKQGRKHIDLLKPEVALAVPLALALWPEGAGGLLVDFVKARAAVAGRSAKDWLRDKLRGEALMFDEGSDAPEADPMGEMLAALVDDEVSADDIERWLLDGADQRLDQKVADLKAPDPDQPLVFGGSWYERVWQKLVLSAARAANKGRTYDLAQPDDLDVVVRRTLRDSDKQAAVVIAGHTHLARAVHYPEGWYFNTGTWADLMHIPPGLNPDEFSATLADLESALSDPDGGPAHFRPFRRLTYVELQLEKPEAPGWSVALRQWPEQGTIVLHQVP